jgi:isoleucyl-tRNA synthetase
MQMAQKVVSLALSIRQKEKIKVRQPLQKMMIPVLSNAQRQELEAVRELVLSEVNVKELDLIDDASGILVKQIKPNFKTLGPKYGKDMKGITQAVAGLQQEDIRKIEQEGEISLALENKTIILQLTDVDISSQDIEGWLVASAGPITVALDIQINRQLKEEGIAREMVSRIQNLRKDAGFEVTDRIDLKIQRDGKIEEALMHNVQYVKSETLTEELDFEDQLEEGTPVEFDEIQTKLLIVKR